MLRLNIVLLFLFVSLSFAQAQRLVKGWVNDAAGNPLLGVNVFDPITYAGTTTDSLGYFEFTNYVDQDFTIQTQYIGYRVDSVRIKITSAVQTVYFTLTEKASALSEVLVTAGAFVASDSRKVAVLSSVDIATTGSTADLVEALNTLPGSTPAGESGQLLVRGGDAAETQAYINGLQVPVLYTSRLPDIPSRTRFSPFAFKGITFASGGFSAQYGNALSGALILDTKDKPEKTITDLSLLSLGTDLTHTQLIGNEQAISVGAGGTNLGLYNYLNPKSAEFISKTPQGLNAQAGYWLKKKDGRNLKLIVQTNSNTFESKNEESSAFYGSNRLGLENKNLYSQATYQQAQGNTGMWKIGSSFGKNEDLIRLDNLTRNTDQFDLINKALYSSNYREKILWRAGLEQQFRAERLNITFDNQASETIEVQRSYLASFAEADWFISSRWIARGGVRIEKYEEVSNLHLSPRGQVSYLFSKDHQLALSAGKYIQRQSNENLFGLDHKLQPAQVDYYGLTYSNTWQGRVLRLEAYAKDYKQLSSNTSGQFETSGFGYSRGFDLFYRDRKTVKNADFWISYSFNDSKRVRDNVINLSPVPFAARHNFALVAKRFFVKPGLGLSVTYQYHNGRPFDNPNIDGRYSDLSPDFYNLSATVSYLTNIKGHFTVIFASMNNLTDARQVNRYRYALQPNTDGIFERMEIDPVFRKFPFVGVFVSLGDKERLGSVDDI